MKKLILIISFVLICGIANVSMSETVDEARQKVDRNQVQAEAQINSIRQQQYEDQIKQDEAQRKIEMYNQNKALQNIANSLNNNSGSSSGTNTIKRW